MQDRRFFIKTIFEEGKWFFIIPTILLGLSLLCLSPSNPLVWWMILGSLFVAGYTLFFLRPPNLLITPSLESIYASADGYILDVKTNVECPYFPGEPFHQVIIFMHIASMHWNQAPIEGEIVHTEFRQGLFQNTMKIAESWKDNEHQVIAIHNTTHNIKAVVIMVAGLIARRIRFFKRKGDLLQQGEALGLIRYGSANVIYFPASFQISVKPGQKSRAGKTVLAQKTEISS